LAYVRSFFSSPKMTSKNCDEFSSRLSPKILIATVYVLSSTFSRKRHLNSLYHLFAILFNTCLPQLDGPASPPPSFFLYTLIQIPSSKYTGDHMNEPKTGA
jgi:hypothetical protein